MRMILLCFTMLLAFGCCQEARAARRRLPRPKPGGKPMTAEELRRYRLQNAAVLGATLLTGAAIIGGIHWYHRQAERKADTALSPMRRAACARTIRRKRNKRWNAHRPIPPES